MICPPDADTRWRPEVTGADGKRRQKRKRFKTLKEAVDHYTAIAGDRGRGLHVAPSELTVQEAVVVIGQQGQCDDQRL
ncbi:Arm DNA-binding domain-containing protein, partial [Mycobacteroides abscessus]|uniref:Arm DNA-binding domain-containing protein n=1 Tax=Mycobacteroides abscessus TaxID=36809 RepID=UPI003CEFF583